MKEYIFQPTGIYYRINEFQIHRRTIIFIHGLSGCSSAWEPYEREFMDKYNLLCIDLRGHGCSRKYPEEKDYIVELFVKDIERMVAHLQIKEFIVVSHSFGSIVSTGLIKNNPSKIKGAVFLAPVFEPKHSVRTETTLFLSGVISSLAKIFPISTKPGKRIDYSRFLPTSDWDMQRIWFDIGNTGVAIYLFCLNTLYRSMDDNFYNRLDLPVMIIHGKRDSYVSVEHSMQAAKKIPGAKFVSLPNADHMLIFNYPQEISKTMAIFFDSFY
jgi:pimeloyl-ACP methyl ester carboxylesterase